MSNKMLSLTEIAGISVVVSCAIHILFFNSLFKVDCITHTKRTVTKSIYFYILSLIYVSSELERYIIGKQVGVYFLQSDILQTIVLFFLCYTITSEFIDINWIISDNNKRYKPFVRKLFIIATCLVIIVCSIEVHLFLHKKYYMFIIDELSGRLATCIMILYLYVVCLVYYPHSLKSEYITILFNFLKRIMFHQLAYLLIGTIIFVDEKNDDYTDVYEPTFYNFLSILFFCGILFNFSVNYEDYAEETIYSGRVKNRFLDDFTEYQTLYEQISEGSNQIKVDFLEKFDNRNRFEKFLIEKSCNINNFSFNVESSTDSKNIYLNLSELLTIRNLCCKLYEEFSEKKATYGVNEYSKISNKNEIEDENESFENLMIITRLFFYTTSINDSKEYQNLLNEAKTGDKQKVVTDLLNMINVLITKKYLTEFINIKFCNSEEWRIIKQTANNFSRFSEFLIPIEKERKFYEWNSTNYFPICNGCNLKSSYTKLGQKMVVEEPIMEELVELKELKKEENFE